MKLFIDSGNLKEIEALVPLGIIDGITTNPSLLAKEGGDYRALLKRICDIVQGPTSAEVVATDVDGMLREGRDLATIDEGGDALEQRAILFRHAALGLRIVERSLIGGVAQTSRAAELRYLECCPRRRLVRLRVLDQQRGQLGEDRMLSGQVSGALLAIQLADRHEIDEVHGEPQCTNRGARFFGRAIGARQQL